MKNSKMVSKFKNLTKHLPIKGRRSEVNKNSPPLNIPWLIEYHHSDSCVTRGLSEGGARPTRHGASGSSDCPVANSENVTPFRFQPSFGALPGCRKNEVVNFLVHT